MNDPVARTIRILTFFDDRLTTARQLANREGVSERTIYRYIDRLRSAGVDIRGERGVGYMLKQRDNCHG